MIRKKTKGLSLDNEVIECLEKECGKYGKISTVTNAILREYFKLDEKNGNGQKTKKENSKNN